MFYEILTICQIFKKYHLLFSHLIFKEPINQVVLPMKKLRFRKVNRFTPETPILVNLRPTLGYNIVSSIPAWTTV